jgi:hypothetical protein
MVLIHWRSSSSVGVFIVLVASEHGSLPRAIQNTRSDNKVHELATMCLPWQKLTEPLIWFDDVFISVFHSCVVVDLWQSLSEWRLLLSVCVLVCCCKNVGA